MADFKHRDDNAQEAIVVGCGLSGAVTARYLAEEQGYIVTVYERRDHIAGNMYDYVDDAGVLVHKYGPHTFHTQKNELYDFMCQYGEWIEYKLTCGAIINGKFTPTPFNFQTIDDFFDVSKAEAIKKALLDAYPDQQNATVLELLLHGDMLIREYATFLFDNDYSLYTAKQWGISPREIDPDVLKRVPIRFNYEVGYFEDEYQVMPRESYVSFFRRLLDHPNIHLILKEDVIPHLEMKMEEASRKGKIILDGREFGGPFVFTGAIDELFGGRFGYLPYRSLRFEWKTENKKSFQEAPVVAYPQEKEFTRITEYTKLPVQNVGEKTSYAVEYSLPYQEGVTAEPYYPIPNEENHVLYEKYLELSKRFPNLYLCGRLADYKYYNMDQALERALAVCKKIQR